MAKKTLLISSLIIGVFLMAGCGSASGLDADGSQMLASTSPAHDNAALEPITQTLCTQILGTTLDIAPSFSYTNTPDDAEFNTCQASATVSGVDYTAVDNVFGAVKGMILTQGFKQDSSLDASGPGAEASGYRLENQLCKLYVESVPSEASLCSGDEAFASCWEKLTPEQRIYSVTLECSE